MCNPLLRTLLVLCLGYATLVAAESQPTPLPLGVYWPGEYAYRDANKQLDWPRNEAVLDQLAKASCNTIWLTHLDAAQTAEFARRAGKRGIRLVAALGELDGSQAPHRQANQAERMAGVLKQWGDAPKPIAWGLGDEPRPPTMTETAVMVKAWTAAGHPVTTVTMAGDVPSQTALMRMTFLTSDIYPFFSTGDPDGPDNLGEMASYVADSGRRVYQRCHEAGMPYWFMGAAFQVADGPCQENEKGDVVYLPGGNAHFRMPSVAEVRWQNWSALATGARGLIIFSLFFPSDPKPEAPAIPASRGGFGVTTKTDSHAPGGLLYMDGRETPQFTALGASFARIASVGAILSKLEPTQELTVFHAKGWIPPGDVVQPFRDPAGGLYALVVNGNLDNEGTVAVNVPATTRSVTDLVSGKTLDLIADQVFEWEPIGSAFRQVRVVLPPGEGTLLRIDLPAKKP